jgi:large conductance mechanosensitive channel
LGIPDFTTWTITVGDAEMSIGAFRNTLISVVTIAGAIFLLVVKPMQRLYAVRAAEPAPAGPTEIDLLAEIRDELRKRPRQV